MDYEQAYYDLFYENKKLKAEKELLEVELDIYKKLLMNKPVKKIIADDLIKYLRDKKVR